MADERLDVGFVPAECPGRRATGATYTSTLLIEHLSWYHDLTVYVSSQMEADPRELPASDRVEYVLRDDLPKLPHPIWTKIDALREELDSLEGHDLVHSYSSAFVPVLADLETPTVVSLNSYLPVCPKADLRYRGERKCTGPSPAKCAGCVAATSLKRRQGLDAELRSSYVSFGQIPFVERSRERSDDISAYHVLSPHLRDDYIDLGFPKDRMQVIPHFYDEVFHSPVGTVTDPARTDQPITLLYVGALQDIKGVDTLVRALATIRERGYDVTLRIAGTGPLEGRLRSLAADLGVAEHVEWLGFVDHGELPDVYDAADAFVYPGVIDEPFGRVMLEALASHTPILSSDVGSMDYIVGPAGRLFAPGDAASLADAFEELLAAYPDHQRAIPDQLRRFSPDTVIDSFLDLYASTAGVPARSAVPQ